MTTTQDRATAVDPASGRPPVAAPAAGYVGALIALLILAVGAVATLGAATYGLLVVRRDRAMTLSDGVTAEAIADAASELDSGAVPAVPVS